MTGTTLGHYEIVRKLGEGGMGAVYLARDTRLGRDVAIKMLPADVASAQDRLLRFEREAHVLASLNHPNIATLYGFEELAGVPVLVMELVAGQTLRDRIARGSLPVTEALGIARQMADGLEAAHDKGIVHRDLKPANAMITPDGRVKLLDFGLAKAFDRTLEAAEVPTVTMSGTAAGAVLGTVSYMSPEQARGAEVDKRTDIWAFGCCLFEMLTGRRTFGGETPTDTMAKILEVEPEWSRLDGRVPGRMRELLARCLTKDPRNRLHDIADARIEIERALSEPVVPPPATRRWWRGAALASALAAGAAGVAVGTLTRSSATPEPSVTRTVIPLRVSDSAGAATVLDRPLTGNGASVAISPDGRTVAFVLRSGGTSRLYVRRLDQFEATLVEGSDGAILPLFAPDARYLAFVRDGVIFRAALTGGAPTRMVEGIDNARGVDWCGDEIVFNRDVSTGLYKASTRGGPRTPLTSLDLDRREKSHRFPHLLPGCRAVLFTIGTSTTESWADGDVAVASTATGEYRTVLRGGVHARYSPRGHIIYHRAGTLYAVASDVERLEVTGPPMPVVPGVMSDPAGGSAEFALAQNGTLVYAPGRSRTVDRQLVRIDRRGRAEPLLETPRAFGSFGLSPDGGHVAAHVMGGIGSIWLLDLARGTPTRWTTEWDNTGPVWDPTGRQIIFSSSRRSAFDLYRQSVEGGAAAERIVASEFAKVPTSWSPDGTTVAYDERGDIFTVDVNSGTQATPFLNSRARERSAAFSPSGQWLAYVSDESGQDEVYARRFPDGGGRRRISVDGGTNPVWNPDGTELVYRNGFKMMSVAIPDARNMVVARPRMLYERRFGRTFSDAFALTPDGRYFIDLDDTVAEPPPTELVLVQHFADELRRLAPPGR